jgi:hypothetical protein
MTEKIYCAKIDFNDGDTLTVRLEDWKEQISKIDSLLFDGEDGYKFTLSLIEMDEEEYENLREFDGF